ncbi:MAG: DUF3261 domain-containing protein [Caldilineaceae bacterium]
MPRLIALLSALLMCACSALPVRRTQLPQPMLSRHTGTGTGRQPRLSFPHATAAALRKPLDARLEIDEAVRLAGFAMGHRVLAVHWDGTELTQQRAPELPPQVDAARILRDVLYVLAPARALQAALPKGWQVQDSPAHRELLPGTQAVDRSPLPRAGLA